MRGEMVKFIHSPYESDMSGIFTCPNCDSKKMLDIGGSWRYKNSEEQGHKFRCTACGAVGIIWDSMMWARTEQFSPDGFDLMSKEIDQPIDENYDY